MAREIVCLVKCLSGTIVLSLDPTEMSGAHVFADFGGRNKRIPGVC